MSALGMEGEEMRRQEEDIGMWAAERRSVWVSVAGSNDGRGDRRIVRGGASAAG